ncbi:MAG: hypothetical protein JWM11_4113 [Planctomycetaceae bacterium]|nr:hypothetical protein [Planctomycetaceae bacterium]
MAHTIPDLWRMNEDVPRLYQFYLLQLMIDEQHERIVSACRRIRQYAKRGPGIKDGLFTFWSEINALCELKNYRAAWQQLRRCEYIIFGRRFDLKRGQFPPSNGTKVFYYYAPILYFLGRYREGCDLLEHELGLFLKGTNYISYEIRFHVANNLKPSDRFCVTLAHFYTRLGRKLREWKQSETFVNAFHPSFFRILGVEPEVLLTNSKELRTFLKKLNKIPRTQLKRENGCTILLKTARKARKQTESAKRKQEQIDKQFEDAKQARTVQLKELFPELRALLK